MIIFKNIRWQNLLSTGNVFTEVDFLKHNSALIVGKNGAGKSTILDAFFFVLYGKPYRKINKPDLINSINGKGLLVEIEFSIGTKEYLVRRGIKPNIFEIYQNGTLIDQSSETKEYQEFLEKQILKMNIKACRQIVILSATKNYIPFMELTTGDRREVVEDILDLQVFTLMNTILKQKISNNKIELDNLEHELNIIERSIETHNKSIEAINTNNTEIIAKKKSLIQELIGNIEEAEQKLEEHNSKIEELTSKISDANKVSSKKMKLLEYKSKIQENYSNSKKESSFYEKNDECPTCQQGISEDFKNQKIETLGKKQEEFDKALTLLEKEFNIVDDRLNEIQEINNQIQAENSAIRELHSDIRSWKNSIATIEKEIESLDTVKGAVSDHEEEIAKLEEQREANKIRKGELVEEKQMMSVSAALLKDTGIKTKIIRQYIPIINQYVNKYLSDLDFFVNFELDEKFDETIKSRYRDKFSYSSFSEGEKFRIDISLMLTWREIAKLRNSTATNLLIMDEIFDSSLDSEGTDEFMKLLNILVKDTSVLVISHKGDVLYDKFPSILKFEKNNNFSKLVTS